MNRLSDNNFEQCIKCTVCTVYCPLCAVSEVFPGPKQAGPDGERLRLKDKSYYDTALKMCLNCKRCEISCPSNVRIADIIQAARAQYGNERPGLRDYFLASTDLVGGIASRVSPIVNMTLRNKGIKYLMDKALKVDRRRKFPEYSSGTFRGWYFRHAAAAQMLFSEKIAYFHGCYVNYNNPALGKDFIKIMNALGYGVELLDKEKCCGVAMIANGMYGKAASGAKSNLGAIRRKGLPLVGTSSTCVFTLRDEYPNVLGIDNGDIRESIETATRFIYRAISREGKELRFKQGRQTRIAYHTACHMEKMGWGIYSVELLKLIPNVQVILLEPHCCGIAGTYGFKKENYQASQAIGADLFRQIDSCGADIIACDCETCKWQIEMSTGAKCEHPISIIASMIED